MSKKFLVAAALILLGPIQRPLQADESHLQATTAAVVDDTVLVQVDNPNSNDESARIQLTVQLDDGSIEVLTVPTVTYEASSSALVAASASRPIVQIIDDPEPTLP